MLDLKLIERPSCGGGVLREGSEQTHVWAWKTLKTWKRMQLVGYIT